MIQQQEEEELMRLLAGENDFKLLKGYVPSDYRLKEDAYEFSGLVIAHKDGVEESGQLLIQRLNYGS